MGLGGAKRSRSPSDASPVAFAYFAAMGKVGRRPQAAKSPARKSSQRPDEASGPTKKRSIIAPHPSGLTASHLPQGEGFRAAQCAAPTEEGRFSGGEYTALRRKRRLWSTSVGHSGVPKWAGFPTTPPGCAPLAHKFRKTGHPGPPGGAGSGWPFKKGNFFCNFTEIFQRNPPL